ncbi:HPr family phosphocarrier protein [Mycoplasmopsis agassizii]|uniref:Phosphocarrier protein HPr n=1 Tax=Mycoplasmopsis agassizii TaxID=33922 RepID=A0A269TLT8_9BACT|nr:HPr family phosphocarrier protein [Mycoplasmopsis agassizii]PAF54959.1 HPr family phosphocarrier protein [Mycoplasmopsis agassizii]PAK21725.1 HPr family phosphocarrier protein [Mycoplasmopsis agassizii]
MEKFNATVIDPIGLHARPASLVTKEAAKYKSEIKIKANGRESNLKSIMNLMSLGIKQNDSFEITAEGEDAKAAIAGIKNLMLSEKMI